MNDHAPTEPTNGESVPPGAVRKRMLQVAVSFLIMAAILFVSAGRLDWGWAWAYFGLGLVILAFNALLMPRELIAERGQPGDNVKGWDRWLSALAGLPVLAVYLVAGLDERFGWSPSLPLLVHLTGLALFGLGQGLFTWAMISNKYFSTAVRLQMDRGQTVARGGPYRYVRHPGYVGFMLSYFGTALALGSLWALIPAALVVCLLVPRTALEDRTLREELPGYQDYAQQVRYRLLPGIW